MLGIARDRLDRQLSTVQVDQFLPPYVKKCSVYYNDANVPGLVLDRYQYPRGFEQRTAREKIQQET